MRPGYALAARHTPMRWLALRQSVTVATGIGSAAVSISRYNHFISDIPARRDQDRGQYRAMGISTHEGDVGGLGLDGGDGLDDHTGAIGETVYLFTGGDTRQHKDRRHACLGSSHDVGIHTVADHHRRLGVSAQLA